MYPNQYLALVGGISLDSIGLPINRLQKLGMWVFCRYFSHFDYCQTNNISVCKSTAYLETSMSFNIEKTTFFNQFIVKGCINNPLISNYVRESVSKIKKPGHTDGSDSLVNSHNIQKTPP